MKIGLVGEAPNDTQSIQNLLEKKYSSDEYDFFFMLDRIHGSQLDNQKTKRFLRIEYETKNPEIVIFIRDLDALISNKDSLDKRKLYFTLFNRVVDKKGIYLLNIFEIEALILADISSFNKLYDCEVPDVIDPMEVEEPKEFLKKYTKKYSETHNSKVFEKINFNKVLECSYFSSFIKDFNDLLLSKNVL